MSFWAQRGPTWVHLILRLKYVLLGFSGVDRFRAEGRTGFRGGSRPVGKGIGRVCKVPRGVQRDWGKGAHCNTRSVWEKENNCGERATRECHR